MKMKVFAEATALFLILFVHVCFGSHIKEYTVTTEVELEAVLMSNVTQSKRIFLELFDGSFLNKQYKLTAAHQNELELIGNPLHQFRTFYFNLFEVNSPQLTLTFNGFNIRGPGTVDIIEKRFLNVISVDSLFIKSSTISSFAEGQYSYGGGAVRIEGARQVIITDCIFNNNVAKEDGGAIYLENVEYVGIQNSLFEGNQGLSGASNGGAIYTDNQVGELFVSETTFRGNEAGGAGSLISQAGSIYCEHEKTKVTLLYSTFINNFATSARDFYRKTWLVTDPVHNADITITGCVFQNAVVDFIWAGEVEYSCSTFNGVTLPLNAIFADYGIKDTGTILSAVVTETCTHAPTRSPEEATHRPTKEPTTSPSTSSPSSSPTTAQSYIDELLAQNALLKMQLDVLQTKYDTCVTATAEMDQCTKDLEECEVNYQFYEQLFLDKTTELSQILGALDTVLEDLGYDLYASSDDSDAGVEDMTTLEKISVLHKHLTDFTDQCVDEDNRILEECCDGGDSPDEQSTNTSNTRVRVSDILAFAVLTVTAFFWR